MMGKDIYTGYLDVKISAKVRRGFTPWKAWHKQWCELKRLDSIENGVELTLRPSEDGAVLSRVVIPRSSTLCRTESTSKQYAFGVFQIMRTQKPLLFLSGTSESDTQGWISTIRRMLSVASYLPVASSNFHISMIDNDHSRVAGLTGLFGIMSITSQEISICDACTGEKKFTWQWYQFHQFHLQVSTNPLDKHKVCVMHTSSDFQAGPGQLYLYCEDADNLLRSLLRRGKSRKLSLAASHRLSRSESDLHTSYSPVFRRSNCGSDDSGVRVSLTSEESDSFLKNKMSSSLVSIGLLAKTPGGSEADDDSLQDLTSVSYQRMQPKTKLPRRESGISLSSGVYEEISETPPKTDNNSVYTNGHIAHVYEDPLDVVSRLTKTDKQCVPPPLPPRVFNIIDKDCDIDDGKNIVASTETVQQTTSTPQKSKIIIKYRCNTLPSKDLRKISQIFTSDTDYMSMTPKLKADKEKMKEVIESDNLYVPMSPIINFKTKIENYYMVMSGKKC